MKAYLILSDGTIFEGEQMGERGNRIGEAVFTTSMGGYMETLTDPSYFGQIIVQTFPLIGNYGAVVSDAESSKSHVAGYVVRELCQKGSSQKMECELNDFLLNQGISGIKGIDTRALTKKLRAAPMNAMITDSLSGLDEKIKQIRAYKIVNAVSQISRKQITQEGEGTRIVLCDFGAKNNIQRELIKRGCQVICVPHNTSAQKIMELKPDGILLSNGAGNPADNKEIVKQTQKLLESKIPMFGICLGHQLMCLASNGKTKKMRYGHRGGNQPVRELDSGKIYITSQNHGYAVVAQSLDSKKVRVTMVNANDKTCEGIEFVDAPAFSVQFHPEACCGPHDTMFLFDKFVALAKEYAQNRRG